MPELVIARYCRAPANLGDFINEMGVAMRFTVVLASVLVVSGCGWWGASAATLTAVPSILIDRNNDHGEHSVETRIVAANPASWQRRVVPGNISSGASAADSQVLIEWRIPFQTTPGVEAVAAVANVACLLRSIPPTYWRVVSSSGQAVGEAWWVDPQFGQGLDPVGHRLGWVRADATSTALELPDQYRFSWILVLPKPDHYWLYITWQDEPSVQLMAIEPCIDGWIDLPIAVAFAATSEFKSTASPEIQERTPILWGASGGALSRVESVNTSDEGASLGLLNSLDSVSATKPAAASVSDIGLLGIPTYDIVRLHQLAARIEVGLQVPTTEMTRILLQAREHALRSLSGQDDLCVLVMRHALSERRFRLWNNEATIPARMLTHCH